MRMMGEGIMRMTPTPIMRTMGRGIMRMINVISIRHPIRLLPSCAALCSQNCSILSVSPPISPR